MFATERIKDNMKKACSQSLKQLGFTVDLDKTINAETDLDYIDSLGFSDYVGFSRIDLDRLHNEPDFNINKVTQLVNIVNVLSIYWILCNGVRFAIDFDTVSSRNFEPDQSLMNLLSKSNVEDFIFDFYRAEATAQCRLQKQHDKVRISGKFYSHWIFSYSKLSLNKRDDSVRTFEIILIPELHPKIFAINNLASNACSKCGICRKVEDGCFQHSDGATDNSIEIYRMSRNIQRTLESDCSYKDMKSETDGDAFLHHNIRDYLNVCLYAVDKYLRRKTIVKRSKDSSSDKDVQVSVGDDLQVSLPKRRNSYEEVAFVTIHDLVKYEKKNKISHGHHASPREHVRRSTERHLKDGRVIPVRSCVINKGKGDVKKQTVYTVK